MPDLFPTTGEAEEDKLKDEVTIRPRGIFTKAKVQADEPGNKLYALHKTADVNVYVMLERYDDQAALDAHRAAPHFKELGRKLGDYLAGRPDVQVMQEV